jgi:hypothetical protein
MAGAWQLTLPGVVESLGVFPCRPVGRFMRKKLELNTKSPLRSCARMSMMPHLADG